MPEKKRSAIIAFILSCIFTGLGHMYLGKLRRGIIFFLIFSATTTIFAVMSLWDNFSGFILGATFSLIFLVVLLIDVVIQARRRKTITLKRYQKWYFYACYLAIILLLNLFIIPYSHDSYRSFHAASNKMAPTLFINEVFMTKIIEPSKYKIKRDEIIIAHLLEKPSNGPTIVSKIYALPGDELSFRNHQVYLNGIPNAELTQHNKWYQLFKPGSMVVAPNNILVGMSENVISSSDNKYVEGTILLFVDKSQIFGKHIYILWSKDHRRIGKRIKDPIATNKEG